MLLLLLTLIPVLMPLPLPELLLRAMRLDLHHPLLELVHLLLGLGIRV